MKYNIDFLICNYNTNNLLDSCISSILNLNSDDLQINLYVYDNNSHDKSLNVLRKFEESHKINVVYGKENLGYGKAINRLFNMSKSDHIFILNPDTILDFDSNKINNIFHLFSKIDIIGFKILNPERSLQKHITIEPGLFWLFVSILRKGYPFLLNIFYDIYFILVPNLHSINNVFISGCALFMKRNTFSIINGFNEKYFLYFEDTEFFKTAVKKNLVIKECDLTILHNSSYSVKNSTNKIKTQIYKSALLYYKSNIGKSYFYKAKILLFIAALICILNPINVIFRKNIKYYIEIIKISFEIK